MKKTSISSWPANISSKLPPCLPVITVSCGVFPWMDQEAWCAAIADALLIRVTRRALFENAEVEERLLEMHAGLAE